MTSGVRLATGASGPWSRCPSAPPLLGPPFSIAAADRRAGVRLELGTPRAANRDSSATPGTRPIAGQGAWTDVADSLPRDLVADTGRGRCSRRSVSTTSSSSVRERRSSAFDHQGPSTGGARRGRARPEDPDRLHKGLGDTVSVAGTAGVGDQAAAPPSRRMRIVGSFAVPRLPFQSDENPAQGAALTPDGLSSISGSSLRRRVHQVPRRCGPDRRRPAAEGGDGPAGLRRDLRATGRGGARRAADLGRALVPRRRPGVSRGSARSPTRCS